MATKKKLKLPTYYAYYDEDTSVVTGITAYPEPNRLYVEIPYDRACKFIDLIENYSDYIIGVVKKNGKQFKGLVERQVVTYTPRAGAFDRITEGASKQDLIIEWNFPNKAWVFSLNTTDVGGLDDTLLFFINREVDFNQLVVTIPVSIKQLQIGPVAVPFTTTDELDINKLEIMSKLVLGSYGIRIIHD